MKNITILLSLLLVPVFVSAETSVTPTLQFGTDFSGRFGYKEPGLNFSGGLEVSAPVVWISVEAGFSPTDKVLYGNTNSYGGNLTALGRLPKGFLLGGGISYTNLRFVDLGVTKEAIRPKVTAGWENARYRLLFSGYKSLDVANHTSGFNMGVDTYIYSQLRLEVGLAIMTYDTASYHQELGRTTGTSASVNIVYLPFR